MFEQTIEIAHARGGRTVEQKGWVDTGAVFCQFPASLLESLGYQPNDTRRLRLADGTSIESPVGPVLMRFGRGVFQPVICVFGESEDSLIGAIALETFGLVVDPVRKILAPTESLMLTMILADDVRRAAPFAKAPRHMLRRDTTAHFEKTGTWIFSRYRLIAGALEAKRSLNRAAYDALMCCQSNEPVQVLDDRERRRSCWLFRDEFYWDDDGYDATQVKALVLQRLSQKDRRLKHALALMEQAAAIEAGARRPIPDDVRVLVWQRDGGSCVSCGSRERLEFDHVIPVAFGGSNTARNLQLLCETCNRQKGASLV